MKSTLLSLLAATAIAALFICTPDPSETRLKDNLEQTFGPNYRIIRRSGLLLMVEAERRYYAVEISTSGNIIGRARMTEGERSPLDPSKPIH